MPTAANLNHYWGGLSDVAWHGDDEPLFGEYGDSKLIVCFFWGFLGSSVGMGGAGVSGLLFHAHRI